MGKTRTNTGLNGWSANLQSYVPSHIYYKITEMVIILFLIQSHFFNSLVRQIHCVLISNILSHLPVQHLTRTSKVSVLTFTTELYIDHTIRFSYIVWLSFALYLILHIVTVTLYTGRGMYYDRTQLLECKHKHTDDALSYLRCGKRHHNTSVNPANIANCAKYICKVIQ